MATIKNKLLQAWRETRGNLAVELLKWLGGSSVLTAIGKAISQAYYRSPVDWELFVCLVVFGVFLVGIAIIISRSKREEHLEVVAALIGKALDERGMSKSDLGTHPVQVPTPTREETLVDLPPAKPQKFEGEIYRVVTAPKNAFAGMTQQLLKGMGRAADFMLDIDILVEFYIVNVSSETQYIRDLAGSVEIDGHRVQLTREADFDAWEVNHDEYEYCLDPEPDGNKFDLPARATPLNPLFASGLPTTLEPRKPLDGWVRFLLRETNPDKLEGNQTYQFILKDSLGEELNITRASSEKRITKISTRSKRSRRP
jgi:hypothetical protein